MKKIERVVVIGATGMLARPVIRCLVKEGFSVRALVRNVQKAKESLPKEVDLIEGNLQEQNSLEKAMRDMDAVYINLSTLNPKTAFVPERDGTKAVIAAAKKMNLKRISKISALGISREIKWWYAQHKVEEEEAIIQSGIAYTIFRPTWFMESLPVFVQKGKLNIIGNSSHQSYWISGDDYGKQVANALHS